MSTSGPKSYDDLLVENAALRARVSALEEEVDAQDRLFRIARRWWKRRKLIGPAADQEAHDAIDRFIADARLNHVIQRSGDKDHP